MEMYQCVRAQYMSMHLYKCTNRIRSRLTIQTVDSQRECFFKIRSHSYSIRCFCSTSIYRYITSLQKKNAYRTQRRTSRQARPHAFACERHRNDLHFFSGQHTLFCIARMPASRSPFAAAGRCVDIVIIPTMHTHILR